MKQYSDKEMADMSDDKWLVVNGVEPKIKEGLYIDFISMADTLVEEHIVPTVWNNIAKYRLHNSEHYKDGIAIDTDEKKRVAEVMEKLDYKEKYLQANREARKLAYHMYSEHFLADDIGFELLDTLSGVISQIDNMTCGMVKQGVNSLSEPTEWVDGVPPANSECEVEINKNGRGFTDCEVLFISKDWTVFNCKYGQLAYETSKLEFRPILTPKQRTIEAAKELCAYKGSWKSTYEYFAETLYDAGMLTMNGESND